MFKTKYQDRMREKNLKTGWTCHQSLSKDITFIFIKILLFLNAFFQTQPNFVHFRAISLALIKENIEVQPKNKG